MVTDSSLGGTEGTGVLYPIPGEHLERPVVPHQRDLDLDGAGSAVQRAAHREIEAHQFRGAVKAGCLPVQQPTVVAVAGVYVGEVGVVM